MSPLHLVWPLLLSLSTTALLAQAGGELGNLSARLRLPAGGAPAIAGAVLKGSGTRTVLVRAVGPGLAAFGVTGTLPDPRLTVFDATGRPIGANDNWESEGGGAAVRDAADGAGAFALAPGGRDAAALVRAGAGPLTIHVVDATGAAGVVLLELYPLGENDAPRLANLSLLATAGGGDDTLTAGFAVRGGVLPLLVRGVGPGLVPLGVSAPLVDPRLTVFDRLGASLVTNDDWEGSAAGAGPLRQAVTDTGAFNLPARSRDAAAVISLGVGAYTVQIAGPDGATGQALVEVYAADAESPEINGSLRGEPGNIQDNVFQSLCIDPRDPNTVYIGTETNGIFKTADGGATWTRLRRGLRLDVSRRGYPQIYEIVVDPERPGTLYAATVSAPGPATGSGVEVLRSGNAGVYKSTDGGLTWQQRINGFINTYTPHVVLSKADSRTLFAGIGGVRSFDVFYDGGLLISRDGAGSWEPAATPAGTPKNTPISMAVTLQDGVEVLHVSYMVHGTDHPTAYGLYRTTDAGRTWEARNPPGLVLQYFDVFAKDHAVIYANDDAQKRIHKTTDGGRTWVRSGLGNFGPIRISPENANVVIYTGFTSLMKSTDGLATARTVLDDTAYLGNRQFMDIRFAPGNPAIVWAAAKGYILYKSTDGGEHFTRITTVRELVYGPGQ